MSDDEADPELLELLRQHLLGGAPTVDPDADTGVLASAEYVYDNAIDVALDMRSCKNAAEAIYDQMQRKHYSTATWGEHELHPTARDESTIDFIFAMDLLNFSFWSDDEAGSSYPSHTPPGAPPYQGGGFAVEYRGKTWTGYYSMVAALRRALDEGIPITSPAFWRSSKCNMALMRHVFRPAGSRDEVWRDDCVEEKGGSVDNVDEAVDEAAHAGETTGQTGEKGEVDEADEAERLPDEAIGHTWEGDVSSSRPEKAMEELGSGEGCGGQDAANDARDGEQDVNGNGSTAITATEATENVSTGEPPDTSDASHGSPGTAKGVTNGAGNESMTTTTAVATGPPPDPSPGLPEMPLLAERLACLQEAGAVLEHKFGGRVANVLAAADGSAAKLVNILAREFACFRDECPFPGDDDDEGSGSGGGGRRRRRRTIRFLKRAQILAAELWACFQGTGYGAFRDIERLTMFADYRVPQILRALGCLYYSPPLATAIEAKKALPSGSSWEVQLRACSIWCVELLRREIKNKHPDAEVNAVLIDFFLYDTMKEMEAAGTDAMPHHRTRSIWY